MRPHPGRLPGRLCVTLQERVQASAQDAIIYCSPPRPAAPDPHADDSLLIPCCLRSADEREAALERVKAAGAIMDRIRDEPNMPEPALLTPALKGSWVS